MGKRYDRAGNPVFYKIFLRKLLMVFAAAILLSIVGTGIALAVYRNYMEMDQEAELNAAQKRVRSAYEEIYYDSEGLYDEARTADQKLEQFKTNLHWIYDSLSIKNFSYAVYDVDTQEVIVEEEPMAYLAVGGEKGENIILYRCPIRDIQAMFAQYDVVTDRVQDKLDPAGNALSQINMQEAYIRDGLFVPGRVELQQNFDTNESEDDVSVVVISDNDTPDHVDQYTKIHVNDENIKALGPMWYKDDINQEAKQLLERSKDTLWKDPDSIAGQSSHRIIGGIEQVYTYQETLGTDMKIKSVIATHNSMFEDYKIWMLVSYLAVFVTSALFTWGSAYHTYMVRKNQYDMDSYRRDMTNAMAHDLKTPLTAVSGYAENLREQIHTEKREYYTEAILENVRYMNQIVNHILELAKLENADHRMQRETIELRSVTEEVIKKYEVLLERSHLAVVIDGDSEIRADRSMLVQMLENLVGNAIKYAKPGTNITVKLSRDCFEIRNAMETELNIPVEDLWKPFVKGDDSRNGQRGSGIGLTIVKNIADILGYTFAIERENYIFIARITYNKTKKR